MLNLDVIFMCVIKKSLDYHFPMIFLIVFKSSFSNKASNIWSYCDNVKFSNNWLFSPGKSLLNNFNVFSLALRSSPSLFPFSNPFSSPSFKPSSFPSCRILIFSWWCCILTSYLYFISWDNRWYNVIKQWGGYHDERKDGSVQWRWRTCISSE